MEKIYHSLSKAPGAVRRGVGKGYLERRGKTEFQVMTRMGSLMA